MERIPMTGEGYKALEDEIDHLKTVERPTVIRSRSSGHARRSPFSTVLSWRSMAGS